MDETAKLAIELARPIELKPASGEWMAARLAVQRIMDVCRVCRADAVAALCRRAVRVVPINAITWSVGEEPHSYINRIEYFSENKRNNQHFKQTLDRKSFEEISHFFEALEWPEAGYGDWDLEYADWETGDFKVRLDRDFSVVALTITGLQFDRLALEMAIGNVADGAEPKLEANARKSGGRPPSAAWPVWVAELARYLHDNGFPAGAGSQGQEAMINAIAERLAVKGLHCPTRSTVQPIVQAVLNRLRETDG